MKLVVLAAVAGALALSACGGDDGAEIASVGGLAGVKASAEAAPVARDAQAAGAGITVVGSGSVAAVPDVSDWSFGVESQADTAEAALAANAASMKRLLDVLRAAGLDRDDLRTEHVSLYPRTSDDGRSIVGYTASSTVHATVRPLSRAGAVVDAAVAAGANQVYGPSLRRSDAEAQYRAAVDAAYDDARARAEAIAAKAGIALGAPVAIVEGGGGQPGPVYDAMGGAEAAAARVPIEPGKQDVVATLTVTFAIS